MSQFLIVHSRSPKGEISRVLIKTEWIIEVSESINAGSYIVISEENAVTCEETLDEIIQMIESKAAVSEIVHKKKEKKKKSKLAPVESDKQVVNINSKPDDSF